MNFSVQWACKWHAQETCSRVIGSALQEGGGGGKVACLLEGKLLFLIGLAGGDI